MIFKITRECDTFVSLSQGVKNEGELESQITIFSASEISVIATWSSKAWHEENTCLVLIRCMSFRQQKTKENHYYFCLDKIPAEPSSILLYSEVYLSSYDMWMGKKSYKFGFRPPTLFLNIVESLLILPDAFRYSKRPRKSKEKCFIFLYIY